ncbi:hypothetical protein WJX72_009902 [[Myrmecia] bisecta]|uniref:protein-serine/threonine phosphatase n=1 Tax=[Myrmecia] bisecta TaxID=41462 RepID=A0AAW1R9C7_9CHLO
MAETQKVVIKWAGKELTIPVEDGDTVASLKRKIEVETLVQPKRQKLLGLKAKGGKLAQDDSLVADLLLKPGAKVMMMGQPETDIAATDQQAEVAPHVQDDFDVKEGELQEIDAAEQEENLEKLRRRVASVTVKVLNAPRPGKKCLVLDIDYTIFDLNSTAERPHELARPYLHQFMTAAYEHYDLVIWSATSMKWVEVKMRELGVTTHPDYKISFMLDNRAMITVKTAKYGLFDCKPLAFIWAKFPEVYNRDNTIMFDDLRRNYVMNRQNGLVIRPYHKRRPATVKS